MTGIKHDNGKPRWELLPWRCVEEVVKVLTFGAAKYPEPDNWKRVPEAKDRYFAALIRHLIAWKEGRKKDKETGLLALAHACCCLLFLMWFDFKE